MSEVLGILIEIRVEAIGGDDDRVLLQTPSRRFVAPRQELQARRLDGREVLLRMRSGRRDDGTLAVASFAAGDGDRCGD
jgi:hypothetical protein